MIDVRAAVILLGSAGCGVVTGALRLVAGDSWPNALLAAAAASGIALGVLATVVKADDSL